MSSDFDREDFGSEDVPEDFEPAESPYGDGETA